MDEAAAVVTMVLTLAAAVVTVGGTEAVTRAVVTVVEVVMAPADLAAVVTARVALE